MLEGKWHLSLIHVQFRLDLGTLFLTLTLLGEWTGIHTPLRTSLLVALTGTGMMVGVE